MIVLYNPISTTPGKQPLPLSLLSLAAVLEAANTCAAGGAGAGNSYAWSLVDGNVVPDPAAEIIARLTAVPRSRVPLLAVTVMPGPQLTQAVAVCRRVKDALPHVPILWGGYFPTQHTETVLRAPYVDFVVRSQGERALVQLVDVLRSGGILNTVGGLSWKTGRSARSDGSDGLVGSRSDGSRGSAGSDPAVEIVNNPVQPLTTLDELPDLPYHRVDMARYLHNNYLGRRTIAHNSSFGCPFACSFCAVVSMSNRRWLAQTPARMERVMRHLVTTYGVDAVQMHDMDFFISEARTAEFAHRIADLGIRWWALGRVDTLMQYSDATWDAMARSGLKMIFSGAESGTDEALARMNKGGKSSAALTLELAHRMRGYGIVPEFSFVLGCPPDPEQDVATTFAFIRRIKQINPATEIVLYTYTPVPLDGSLYAEAQKHGFAFPETLDEWATPAWQQLSMRRGDGIPWMDGHGARMRRRVRNFERVINAYYPTVTDARLSGWRRAALKAASAWRYRLRWYGAPYELRALHRLIHYQRPETTGF
jgi:anaerobic magnesium-protoporphyrin IX monomethyl ester cyclase